MLELSKRRYATIDKSARLLSIYQNVTLKELLTITYNDNIKIHYSTFKYDKMQTQTFDVL